MAPVKKYKNQSLLKVSRYDILSGTLNNFIKKRKKKKDKLDLSKKSKIETALQYSDSLIIKTEDTFDKLMASYKALRDNQEIRVTRSISQLYSSLSSYENESVKSKRDFATNTPLSFKIDKPTPKLTLKDIFSSTPIVLGKQTDFSFVMSPITTRNDRHVAVRRPKKTLNVNQCKNETDSVIVIDDSASLREKSENKIPECVRNRTSSQFLKPGKDWRRSYLAGKKLSVNQNCQVRDSINRNKLVPSKGIVSACVQCKKNSIGSSVLPERLSVRVVPLPQIASANANNRRLSYLENYAVSIYPGYKSNGGDENLFDEYHLEQISLKDDGYSISQAEKEEDSKAEDSDAEVVQAVVTARDVVLNFCKQSEPLPFEKCYPNSILQHCQKIGEGVYGEVFLFRNPNGGVTVIKIIPIEGSLTVNGERQKKFEEILSEITIQYELTNLRDNDENRTSTFSQLHKIMCVKGRYPRRLLELWELYMEMKGTENDSPEFFDQNQLYIVLELNYGGNDMECYQFLNSLQAYSLFKQIACALAVAESSLEFEHRDLHWGNVLVSTVNPRSTVQYRLNGKDFEVKTNGVQATIIDYTLSRIKHNGICIYNDLSLDPDLFSIEGDYQFSIYRLMRKSNNDNWQRFEPYTNILWLHYILDKMVTALRYTNTKSRTHSVNMRELECLRDKILSYKSCEDFVTNVFIDNN